jgi:hypothetical protein
MEVDSLVFCEDVLVSNAGVMVLGAFESLEAPELPMSYGTRLVHVIMRASRFLDAEDVVVMLRVEHKNKEVFIHINTLKAVRVRKSGLLPVDFSDMERLVFEEPGDYEFKFYIEGQLSASKVLSVS